MSKKNSFEESGYYTWMYEGSLMLSHIATGLLIFVVIAFTLLPLWPMIARKVLWYISVTFLLLMLGFISIRLILFLLLWMVGIEFWILPNFFDESLPFWDSFKPIYSLERGSPGQMMYRIASLVAFAAAGYYVYTQPTDWDVMMQTQQAFVEDLYAGKLLPDAAQTMRDTMANARSGGRPDIFSRQAMPKLDDILSTLDAEEEELMKQDKKNVHQDGEFDSDPITSSTSRGRSSVETEEEEVVTLDEDEAASDMMDRLLEDEE